MANLLIPTDFTPASLRLAAQAVKTLNQPVNIILFHAFDLPFYYQDLVRGEKEPFLDMLTDSFRQSCKQLKEQFPGLIGKISFRYMRGNSNSLFRNFAEANDIDMIACPHQYDYIKIHPLSLNPVGFFKKSGIPMLQEFQPLPSTEKIIYRAQKFSIVS